LIRFLRPASSRAPQLLRDRVSSIPGYSGALSNLGPRAGLIAGLATLMGLTAWVVASVSPWMTPVYLALMVLIFVTPQSRLQLVKLSDSNQSAESVADDPGHRFWQSAGASKGAIDASFDQIVADKATEKLPTDPTSSSSHTTVGGIVKQWGGRTRPRRTSKPVVESVPPLTPVAWIRVGPGKFVRADGTPDTTARAQPSLLPDLCVADSSTKPASSTPVAPAPGEAESETEPPSFTVLHPVDSEYSDAAGSSRNTLQLAGDYHTIAPSPFGFAPGNPATADDQDSAATGAHTRPAVEPAAAVPPSDSAAGGDSNRTRPCLKDARLRARARRVLRGFVAAVSAADRDHRKSNARTGYKLRSPVWALVGLNRPSQQSARRVSGRTIQRRHTSHPQSPRNSQRFHSAVTPYEPAVSHSSPFQPESYSMQACPDEHPVPNGSCSQN
jgi:hypothetical protein